MGNGWNGGVGEWESGGMTEVQGSKSSKVQAEGLGVRGWGRKEYGMLNTEYGILNEERKRGTGTSRLQSWCARRTLRESAWAKAHPTG